MALRGRIIEKYFLVQLKEAIKNDFTVYNSVDGK